MGQRNITTRHDFTVEHEHRSSQTREKHEHRSRRTPGRCPTAVNEERTHTSRGNHRILLQSSHHVVTRESRLLSRFGMRSTDPACEQHDENVGNVDTFKGLEIKGTAPSRNLRVIQKCHTLSNGS